MTKYVPETAALDDVVMTGAELMESTSLVVKAMSTDYGTKVTFAGEGAFTDGDDVNLPVVPMDAEVTKRTALVLAGYGSHEGLHKILTGFDRLRPLMQRANAEGKWLTKSMANGLEDVRIEHGGTHLYGGIAQAIDKTAREVNRQFLDTVFVKMPEVVDDFGKIGPVAVTWEGRRRLGYPDPSNEECLSKLPKKIRRKVEKIVDQVMKIPHGVTGVGQVDKFVAHQGSVDVWKLAKKIADGYMRTVIKIKREEWEKENPPTPPQPSEDNPPPIEIQIEIESECESEDESEDDGDGEGKGKPQDKPDNGDGDGDDDGADNEGDADDEPDGEDGAGDSDSDTDGEGDEGDDEEDEGTPDDDPDGPVEPGDDAGNEEGETNQEDSDDDGEEEAEEGGGNPGETSDDEDIDEGTDEGDIQEADDDAGDEDGEDGSAEDGDTDTEGELDGNDEGVSDGDDDEQQPDSGEDAVTAGDDQDEESVDDDDDGVDEGIDDEGEGDGDDEQDEDGEDDGDGDGASDEQDRDRDDDDTPDDEAHDRDGGNVGAAPVTFDPNTVNEPEPIEPGLHEAMKREIDELKKQNSGKGYIVMNPSGDKFVKRRDISDMVLTKRMGKEWYVASKSAVSATVGTVRRKLERVVTAMSRTHWENAKRNGRLDVRRNVSKIVNLKSNVFRNKVEEININTAITILIDMSYSMRSYGKDAMSQQITIAVAEALAPVGVPLEVLGHHTDCAFSDKITWEDEIYGRVDNIVMWQFKDFEDGMSACRGSMGTIARRTSGANADGDAIMWAAQRLYERPEEKKVLFVLSDGQPAYYSQTRDVDQYTRDAVEWCLFRGIEVMGLGILDDSVKQYYPKYVTVHDLEEFGKVYIDEIVKLMLGRAKPDQSILIDSTTRRNKAI